MQHTFTSMGIFSKDLLNISVASGRVKPDPSVETLMLVKSFFNSFFSTKSNAEVPPIVSVSPGALYVWAA